VAEHHRRDRGEREARHRQGGGRISDLKLGLNTGYWAGGPPPNITESIAEAEQLGFDSIWTAEAYGSDGLTPLGWWGSQTSTLKLGTAITQMSARQPAMTAMSAMTIDHLSGGRFILGLGVSGPQVVEGWYGMPFAKPLARTREYIQILRDIWARQGPVTMDGEHYTLPYKGDDATGLGKPLKASIHPLREDIPIYLGAEGPKNIALAAELCDGWLAMLFSPGYEDFYKDALSEGFAKEGARRSFDDFEVCATVPLIVTDDVEAGVDALRPFYALYFGGMGAKGKNFHANVAIRMGYEQMVDEVTDLFLSGKRDDAGAAIPSELIQKLSLIGPVEKLREDIQPWRESIVTTLLVAGSPEMLRDAAELVLA
jgi:F420-dependent oxidoreductase-like protein